MSTPELSPRQQEALRRQQRKYEDAQANLDEIGFVLQGSVTERWMECGKPTCHCHQDPEGRHGPYYQWSWKSRGRTSSVYLTEEQADLCRQWVNNHRRMQKTLKRLREISLRAARLYGIRSK